MAWLKMADQRQRQCGLGRQEGTNMANQRESLGENMKRMSESGIGKKRKRKEKK